MDVSSARIASLNGAQIALRLLETAPAVQKQTARSSEDYSGSADVSTLLAYRKAALSAATEAAQSPPYDPASSLPEGWSMGELVPVDTLAPEYRAFAEGFGATHVRLYGADPVSDEVFTAKVTAALDEWYAGDASYLAAKAEGRVSIRRMSDVLAELGATRAGYANMAFFRGANGTEYFGSGGTGSTEIAPETFSTWWADQTAAGQCVVPGGTMGLDFVAQWAV